MTNTVGPAAHGWKARTLDGFIGAAGPLWTRREATGWAYAILAEEKHTNPAGIVHGGVLTTLLDHALSAIAWEANERRACVTVTLDVQFFASARPGDLIEARGRIVRQARSLVFMRGALSVSDGEIASAGAVLKVITRRSPDAIIAASRP
jgi:uncharacterized protein (TIGR00369 family)